MRSIVTAMTWEYWRRGWPIFLGVLAYMIGIPLSIAGVESLRTGTNTRSADIDTLPLHCIFLWLGFGVFCSAVLAAQGERKPSSQSEQRQMFPARLYAMPASAWLIVGCQTLQGVVTIAVLFLLTTTAYELAFDVSWPILGPMLFLSMAFVCLQAGTWSLRDFRFWKLGIYVSAVAALVYWLMQRYSASAPFQPTEFWRHVTAGEVLTMAACAAGAFAVAVNGMARSRRGDARGAERIQQWLDRFPDLFTLGRRQHGSAEVALFRTIFWRHGVAMPAGLGMVMMGILAVAIGFVAFGGMAPHETLKFLIGFALMGISLLPLGFGAMISQDLCHNWTLPASNSTLARGLLRAGAAGCVSAWLICGSILLTAVTWVWLAEGGEAVEHTIGLAHFAREIQSLGPLMDKLGSGFVPFSLFMMCLMSWTCQGLGISLSLVRRNWLAGCTMGIIGFGWLFVLAIFNEKLIGLEAAHLVLSGSVVVFGLLCLCGSAWAWVAARRHQLVSQRATLSAVVVWLVLCGIVTPALFDVSTASWGFMLAMCGGLTLPLTPLAATPLAIRWQRHQ